MDNKTIGDRVRLLRDRKSLAEFGSEIGVSAQQISRIETDQSNPSFELAVKICEKYNVSLDWLMRGIDQPVRHKVTIHDIEGNDSYIMVSKDEFIELQRLALLQQDERVKELQRKVEDHKKD